MQMKTVRESVTGLLRSVILTAASPEGMVDSTENSIRAATIMRASQILFEASREEPTLDWDDLANVAFDPHYCGGEFWPDWHNESDACALLRMIAFGVQQGALPSSSDHTKVGG